ncbi:ATP-binding protein [Thalassotalea ponticola]|uniref:ATP-binding protein n=1 Tax=Thalassotalea ponticola TaxID=1523392 RepID=UPI0025B37E2D|nr:ATP-binding protein [Thalassotalea ponticola]MDN3652587.1 ATP-binding protein [Thalassotalea ponticola]
MSGLQRIILIDTHLPGLVELKLSGHTNICGTNASGKTTLQRLVPVFFGESPNKVVPATRDNFQKWYLPRESSYIIYEYQRIDQQVCMAVLTSSATGVQYRFIEKPFNVNDFIGDDLSGKRSIGVSEVVKACKREGVAVTKALNTKEFKAVIQNDRAMMNNSSHKRDLVNAARLFSLCEHNAKLRHIEKLIKAVHSKEGKMETIKAMIAAILEEDGVQTPSSKISKSQVEDWRKECSLIRQFDELMPQYDKLKQVNAGVEHSEQRLAQLQHQLSNDYSILAEAIVKAQSDQQLYKEKLTALNAEFDATRDQLNRDISVAKADVSSAEQHLDKIEDDFNGWQDRNIEQHKLNIDRIPSWQSQLQSASEQHALLTAEHQDIEAAYHKRQAELEKKQSKSIAQLSQLKDTITAELQGQQRLENDALHQLKLQQDNKYQRIVSDFDAQLQQANMALQKLTTEIELSGPTTQEQQAMAQLEARIEEAQREEDVLREQLTKKQEQTQQLKYQQIAVHEQLQKASLKVKQAQAKVDEVDSWLNPGERTLLQFLRNECQGWQDNLGKLIDPSLLNRSDLSPVLSDDHQTQNTLFGVCVDTSVIEESELLQSQAELEQQLQLAQQQLTQVINEKQQLSKQLEELNSQVNNAQNDCTALTSKCQFKQQARLRVQEEKTQLRAEQKQALLERKQKRQKELVNEQSKIDKLTLNKAQAIDEHKDACHDEKMEHELHWQQIINDIQQKLDNANGQIDDAKQQYKLGVKAAKKWYQDELANREVDVEQIALLKQQITELSEQIEVTNKHRDSVAEYLRWYDLVFSKQKAQYLQQLAKAKDNKANSERQLANQQSNYRQQKQQYQEQLQQLDKALSEQNELVKQINQIKQQYALVKLPTIAAQQESGTVASRVSEASELFSQHRQALQQIDDYVHYFDNAIGQKSGISLTETWERARSECQIENGQGIMVLDCRKMVKELDLLLTVMVPQHLEGVRNNGLNFGNDLTQYYNILADIDKRIAAQSRRISKQVDQELFLDGVSESSVKIRSRISEFDFWPTLQKFNKLHQQWLADESAVLPDEDYMLTIREVLDVLGRATMTGGVGQLLDIELHLKEGNSNLVIRTDRQLNESSSHGMAYLILCKFLLAFTRLLRGDSKAVIHWPIDEIGTLANKNVKKIFDACAANNISVLGAFPNPESDVLHFFKNRYLIDKNATTQKLRMVQPKVNPIAEKLKQRRAQEVAL